MTLMGYRIDRAAKKLRYLWALLPAAVLLLFGLLLGVFSDTSWLTWLVFITAVAIAAFLGLLLWWEVEAAAQDQPLSREETLKLVSIFGIVVAAMTAAAGFIDSANNQLRKPVDKLTVENCKDAAEVLSSLAYTSPAAWDGASLSKFKNLYDKLLLTEGQRVANGMRTLQLSIENKQLFSPADSERSEAFLACARSIIEACRIQLTDMRLSVRDVLPKEVKDVAAEAGTSTNACPTLQKLLPPSASTPTLQPLAASGTCRVPKVPRNGVCFQRVEEATESVVCDKIMPNTVWFDGKCWKPSLQ
jgi:hypothetical protein